MSNVLQQQQQQELPSQLPAEEEIVPPTRWEVELEFIQSLANPHYLNFLAQNKYLEKPEFLNYLRYLEYWRRPEYAKYLVYPNCLHMLTLLREPQFRLEISRLDVAEMVMADFHRRWIEGSAPAAAVVGQPPSELPAANAAAAAAGTQSSGQQEGSENSQPQKQVVG